MSPRMSPRIAPRLATRRILSTALATLVVGGVAAVVVPATASAEAQPTIKPAASAAEPAVHTASTGTAGARRTFYVSAAGSNRASGADAAAPVRTLAQVTSLGLKPGDKVLLERGSSFTDKLSVAASGTAAHPIVIGSYGASTEPAPTLTTGCVSITGDYVTVKRLFVADCPWAAIHVYGDHDVVKANSVTGSESGVWVDSSATNTLVTRNKVFDNDTMAPNTPGDNDDYGAFGILVNGADTEVSWNRITGQVAQSADYGTDGSAVEIYEAQNTWVHHNTAINDLTFTELGGKTTTDSRFDYNVVTSTLADANFLVTRGTTDAFGPVVGTEASNNSVLLTGTNNDAVYCWGGCTAGVLNLSNNIIDATHTVIWADGPIGGGDNVYWQGYLSNPLSPGDVVADPDFKNPAITAVSGGNLRLTQASPAIDDATTTYASSDLLGRAVPLDGNGDGVKAPDSGAYEFLRR